MKKIIIGVTGGFGTGKSTVAGMFAKLGAAMISADKIAHDLILPEWPVYKKAVSLFGVSILKKDKSIDRKKLGKVVFNNRKRLALLNSLIHPEVIKGIKETIRREGSPSKRIYIIDAPLLIEAGLDNMVDKLVVVTSSRKAQIKRCARKFGLSRLDIQKRIRSQMPLGKKRRLADFVIDNSGSLNSTRRTVEKIWREIRNGTGRNKD